MRAGSANTNSSLHQTLQDLSNKLDSLYKLVEQIWHEFQAAADSGDEHSGSDDSQLAELE